MNNYKKVILDNGIPVYLYINDSLKQTLFNYIVKYGSSGKWYNFNCDDKNYHVLPGYAHFLEHLLGEGSLHGNVYTNFSERNYEANAYTSNDHTSYYFYGINDIKKSIKELIEAIECPIFDDKLVNQSRPAILEEASMWCDDYSLIANSLVEKNLYSDIDFYDNTLSSIGNRKTTKKMTTDDLYNCYNAFYTDNNKVIVIAGNINEKEIIDYLNDIYSKIPKHTSNVILPKYDLEPIRKREEIVYKNVQKDINSLGIKFKKPDDISMNEFYLYLCLFLYNIFMNENKFRYDLVNNKIFDIGCYNQTANIDDYIMFSHSFISENPNSYYEIILDKLQNKFITKEEFDLMKKCEISEEIRNLDYKYVSPSEFGNNMFYTENYSDLENYKKMNYDRFLEIMDKIDFNNYSIGAVKKLK